jgi:hypothetical protein
MSKELIDTQREMIQSQNEYIVLLKEHNQINDRTIVGYQRLIELFEQEVELLKKQNEELEKELRNKTLAFLTMSNNLKTNFTK